MSNSYTTAVAFDEVPCTPEQLSRLHQLLGAHEEAELYPGIRLDDQDGSFLLTTDESACIDDLSPEFLIALGAVLKTAGMPYLAVGVADTSDRRDAGSHGGGEFRIYPNGSLVWGEMLWPQRPQFQTFLKKWVHNRLKDNPEWEHPDHTARMYEEAVGDDDPALTYEAWLVTRLAAK